MESYARHGIAVLALAAGTLFSTPAAAADAEGSEVLSRGHEPTEAPGLSASSTGGPFLQPAGSCVSDADRTRISEQLAAFERSFGPLSTVSPDRAAGEPYAFFPMAGNLYGDVFFNNFVDLDPSPGIRDWDCTDHTYDGHNGHDVDLRSFAEQTIGVPIFAAQDGIVVAAHDGEEDMNTSWDGQPANFVILDHGGGRLAYYWHMKKWSGSLRSRAHGRLRAGRGPCGRSRRCGGDDPSLRRMGKRGVAHGGLRGRPA